MFCKPRHPLTTGTPGYGNSAGLFNRHGLLGMGGGSRREQEDMSPDEDSDTEEYRASVDVDLVTAGMFC